MENVLSPLVGRQREVMEAILRTVPTEQLEEGYKTFIGRVIRESEDSEKEGKVLAEGKEEKCDDDDDDDEKSDKKSDDKKDKKEDKKVEEGIVITGDGEQVITEEVNQEFSDFVKEQRRLAGIE
jgi:hypothetical protein